MAYYAEGCLGLCQSLRQMSKVQQRHQTADRGAHPNDNLITFCLIGNGHYELIPNSNETAEVPNSRHRLFHQMGRS